MFGWLKRKLKLRDEVSIVCSLLRDGRDWTVTEHSARHPTDVYIWVSNGLEWVQLKLEGAEIELSKKEKEALWEAFLQRGISRGETPACRLAKRIIDMYGDKQGQPVLSLGQKGTQGGYDLYRRGS